MYNADVGPKKAYRTLIETRLNRRVSELTYRLGGLKTVACAPPPRPWSGFNLYSKSSA